MMNYLYNGMLLVSFVLMHFAFKQYKKTNELLTSGKKVTATVIDLIESRGDDGSTYKPVFEYVDLSNTKRRFESDVSTSPAPYRIGDKVKIIYNPNNEETRVISYWGLYRWTIILLLIASPFLIIGGGYLLYSRG